MITKKELIEKIKKKLEVLDCGVMDQEYGNMRSVIEYSVLMNLLANLEPTLSEVIDWCDQRFCSLCSDEVFCTKNILTEHIDDWDIPAIHKAIRDKENDN